MRSSIRNVFPISSAGKEAISLLFLAHFTAHLCVCVCVCVSGAWMYSGLHAYVYAYI